MKILLYDIETTPNLGYTWDKYEQTVMAFKKEKQLLSFSYKWLGDKKIHFHRTSGKDDKSLCLKLKALWNEADIVIAQNGDKFDQRVVRARFLVHKLPPHKPFKTVDTLKVARRYFKFNSNSLNDLAQTLKLGKKIQHPGIELWLGCMNDDPACWKLMEKYNKQDVRLLEKVYLRLRPYISNHPDTCPLKGGCPNCGSKNIQRRGIQVTRSRRQQRYSCQKCGAWSLGKV